MDAVDAAQELARRADQTPGTLDSLADQAREAHAEVEAHGRQTVEAAIRAGEALIAAKAQVRHGEWLPWLSGVGIPARTAQAYTSMARNAQRVAHLGSVREALAELTTPRPDPDPDPDPEPHPGQTTIPMGDEPDDWQPSTPTIDHEEDEEVVDAEIVDDDNPSPTQRQREQQRDQAHRRSSGRWRWGQPVAGGNPLQGATHCRGRGQPVAGRPLQPIAANPLDKGLEPLEEEERARERNPTTTQPTKPHEAPNEPTRTAPPTF